MPTPTRCRGARPVGSVAARPRRASAAHRPRTPTFALGVAVKFWTVGWPHGGGDWKEYVVAAGAFDRRLTAVRAGRRVVRLLLNHDPDLTLCDTADGSLRLWADGEALWLAIDGRKRRGRNALALLGSWPGWRQLSVGLGSRTAITDFGTARGLLSRAALDEVSVVTRGAFPGTNLTLF